MKAIIAQKATLRVAYHTSLIAADLSVTINIGHHPTNKATFKKQNNFHLFN